MRRIICIILALTITLLCGCGSKSGGDDAQDSRNTQQEEFVVTPMASGLELCRIAVRILYERSGGLDGGGRHVQRGYVPRFASV